MTKVYIGQNNQTNVRGAEYDIDYLPTVVRRDGDKVYFLFNRKFYLDITRACDSRSTNEGITLIRPETFEEGLRGQIHKAIFCLIDLFESDYYLDVTLDFPDEFLYPRPELMLMVLPYEVQLSISPFARKELLRTLVNAGYDMTKFDFESVCKALADGDPSKVNYLSSVSGDREDHSGDGSPRLSALFAVLYAYSNKCPQDLEAAI